MKLKPLSQHPQEPQLGRNRAAQRVIVQGEHRDLDQLREFTGSWERVDQGWRLPLPPPPQLTLGCRR